MRNFKKHENLNSLLCDVLFILLLLGPRGLAVVGVVMRTGRWIYTQIKNTFWYQNIRYFSPLVAVHDLQGGLSDGLHRARWVGLSVLQVWSGMKWDWTSCTVHIKQKHDFTNSSEWCPKFQGLNRRALVQLHTLLWKIEQLLSPSPRLLAPAWE